MNDHSISIEVDTNGTRWAFHCTANPTMPCRLTANCDCEIYGEYGQDEDGYFHMTYVYPGELNDPVRHQMEPGGECNVANWIENDGIEDCAEAEDRRHAKTLTFPVDTRWEDPGYRWQIAESRADA